MCGSSVLHYDQMAVGHTCDHNVSDVRYTVSYVYVYYSMLLKLYVYTAVYSLNSKSPRRV